MATQSQINARTTGASAPPLDVEQEPHMRDLLKRLANEGGDLMRSEMALAKLEMKDMARAVALDTGRLISSIAVAMMGGLALLAAVIIGLGDILDSYWLAALVVGVVLLLIGGVMARAGLKGLKDPPLPDQTLSSLQKNREWASRELTEFKEEIRS